MMIIYISVVCQATIGLMTGWYIAKIIRIYNRVNKLRKELK